MQEICRIKISKRMSRNVPIIMNEKLCKINYTAYTSARNLTLSFNESILFGNQY